jgi:hypothetical protein
LPRSTSQPDGMSFGFDLTYTVTATRPESGGERGAEGGCGVRAWQHAMTRLSQPISFSDSEGANILPRLELGTVPVYHSTC